jgi:hypothetical protein
MINQLCSIVFVLMLLSGCGWSGTPTRNNDFIPLTSIEITASYPTIANKTSTTLTATGNFSGQFTRDITDQVTWSSGTPMVARFDHAAIPNRVTGANPGTASLKGTVGNISATWPITVTAATISTLAITPGDPTVAKGLNQQFTATANFSDLTSQNITFDAIWDSSAPNVATVSDADVNKGLAQTIAVGTSTIGASFDGVQGSTLLTVFEPVLRSIAISPTNPPILTLSTGNFKATGTYSDGSTADITALVVWSSSNSDIATISGDGTATTLTQGTTSINAALGGISAATTLKTTGGTLTGITVSPVTFALVKNIRGRISATGTFSNGTTRDITGAVTWTTLNSSLATVTNAGGSLAWLNPLTVTLSPTTITATSGSLSATASLTVTDPLLTSIALSTTTLDLTAGTSTPVSVIASFGDGATQDVTSLSEWTSNDTAKATVAAGGLGTERVTSVTAGTTTISASYGGKTVTTPATVTVRSRNIQTLTISPLNYTLNVGNQFSFTATADYGGGTTVDVTKDTKWAWVIETPNVAILTDSVNQPGQVVGVSSGSATLTASFGDKAATQNATITVTGP